MAVVLVLTGILAGLLTAISVLVLGGSIGTVLLAYICGGMVGFLGSLAFTALPRRRVPVLMSQDPR